MKNINTKIKEQIAVHLNSWFYFNELENDIQVRKRRCLKTGLVQRLEVQEVWVFIKE